LGARPLVPRAAVIARVVAEMRQHLRRERGARAAVAVADDLRARLEAEPLTHLLLAQLQQLLHVEVDRARDVALTRVAGAPERAVVLLRPPHVDDRPLAEPRRELLELDIHQPSPCTSSISAAIAGRALNSSSHPSSFAGSSTPSMSRARITHG